MFSNGTDMSQFLHDKNDNNAKATAIPQVFCKKSLAKYSGNP